jgi:hypothetical protein
MFKFNFDVDDSDEEHYSTSTPSNPGPPLTTSDSIVREDFREISLPSLVRLFLDFLMMIFI